MALPLTQLQSLLLDMIAPVREVDGALVGGLTEADWSILLGMIRQHRLGPLLLWQLNRTHTRLAIPQAVVAELAKIDRNGVMRSLVLQRELLRTHRILEQAGITHVALKGAHLAFHAYPRPSLRPLRDLDILVPMDQALAAYRALLAGGLTRPNHYLGSPEARMQIAKHLPPLRSSSGLVSIELHCRLFHPKNDDGTSVDLGEDPQFWQRRVFAPIANTAIPFESPTDLLLHLIVHAVYDHQFNNGPLLLSDLAYLLAGHAIDWPVFWTLAARGGQTRGCLLALKLTERYWGKQAIVWPETEVPDPDTLSAQVDTAALLMLRDGGLSAYVNLGHEIARQRGVMTKLRPLLTNAFPPKTKIAALYPVSEHSPLVYLWYPVRWWHLTTKHLPKYLHSRRQAHIHDEIRQLSELGRWLGHKTP